MSKKSKQNRNAGVRPQNLPSVYSGGPVAHEVHPRTVMGLLELQRDCMQNGINYKWKVVHGSSIITDARNVLLDAFMESGYTHLFMVDSDIGFSSRDVLRAVASGKDVVALPCSKRHPDFKLAVEVMREFPEIPATNLPAYIGGVNFTTIDNEVPDENMILKVERIGTGAMMITRRALELFREKYPDRWYNNTVIGKRLTEFFRFTVHEETKEHWGEDFNFCEDMKAIGVDINVVVDARTEHYGSFGFECDFSKLASNYIKGEVK